MITPAHQKQEYIISFNTFIKVRNILMKEGFNNQIVLDHIKEVMCSRPHSSVQSRDQVLDEFYSKLHERSFKGNAGVVVIELKDVNEIFDELRSTQGSRDP